MLELKLGCMDTINDCPDSFNRTMLELKSRNIYPFAKTLANL